MKKLLLCGLAICVCNINFVYCSTPKIISVIRNFESIKMARNETMINNRTQNMINYTKYYNSNLNVKGSNYPSGINNIFLLPEEQYNQVQKNNINVRRDNKLYYYNNLHTICETEYELSEDNNEVYTTNDTSSAENEYNTYVNQQTEMQNLNSIGNVTYPSINNKNRIEEIEIHFDTAYIKNNKQIGNIQYNNKYNTEIGKNKNRIKEIKIHLNNKKKGNTNMPVYIKNNKQIDSIHYNNKYNTEIGTNKNRIKEIKIHLNNKKNNNTNMPVYIKNNKQIDNKYNTELVANKTKFVDKPNINANKTLIYQRKIVKYCNPSNLMDQNNINARYGIKTINTMEKSTLNKNNNIQVNSANWNVKHCNKNQNNDKKQKGCWDFLYNALHNIKNKVNGIITQLNAINGFIGRK